MNTAIWTKSTTNSYFTKKLSDLSDLYGKLDLLRIFLNDINSMGCDFDFFKNIILKEQRITLNVCSLDHENKMILITYIYSKGPNNKFYIHEQELTKVVNEWMILSDKEVEEIMATEDHGIFTLQENTQG
ncbi:MAG: hypothetical protein WC707_02415 [Candidatus Babeliaceae bacterium]|jgi:hypothetical protein